MSVFDVLNSNISSLWDNQKGFHASQTFSVFASDLARRISSGSALNGAGAMQGEDADSGQALQEKQEQLGKLESALSGSVNYLTEKYGEKAGVAMMGLMYKSLGNSDITEDSLGGAFLDVIRFVDKNFGIQAGDEFMAHLNGSLNDSLNDFFENGLSEEFMVVTTYVGGPAMEGSPGAQLDEQYAQGILEMLEAARVEHGEEDKNPYIKAADKENLLGVLQDTLV